MPAQVHATNVVSIKRAHRKPGTRGHHKFVLSPGSRKVIPMTRMTKARRVRRIEYGSTALLVAASITAALAIARFYLARTTLLSPATSIPARW